MVAPQKFAVRAAFRLQRQVACAEQRAQGHDGLLAKRVDRRVRDLREALPQVTVDAARRASERGDGDVIAHRPDGLGARLGHDVDHELDVLQAPAMQRVVGGEILERLEVDVVPFHGDEHAVGEECVIVPTGGPLFGVRVAQQRPVARVDEQHLTRAQPSALDHVLGRHRHDAGFRRRGDQAFPGALPAKRAQAVAVEGRPHHDAVTESECGGSVPRLEPDRLVAVEVAHRRGEVAATFPCIRHQAHQRLADLPSALHEQLEGVVQRRGVRSLGPDRSTELRLELRLARSHPGAVASDRVDLAVVGEHAEWLRESPVGHGVGRVALMENGDAALARLVPQVEVKVSEPRARHQSFVDERAARARGDVHLHALRLGPFFGAPASPVQAALPLVSVKAGVFDEAVPDGRHRLSRALSE